MGRHRSVDAQVTATCTRGRTAQRLMSRVMLIWCSHRRWRRWWGWPARDGGLAGDLLLPCPVSGSRSRGRRPGASRPRRCRGGSPPPYPLPLRAHLRIFRTPGLHDCSRCVAPRTSTGFFPTCCRRRCSSSSILGLGSGGFVWLFGPAAGGMMIGSVLSGAQWPGAGRRCAVGFGFVLMFARRWSPMPPCPACWSRGAGLGPADRPVQLRHGAGDAEHETCGRIFPRVPRHGVELPELPADRSPTRRRLGTVAPVLVRSDWRRGWHVRRARPVRVAGMAGGSVRAGSGRRTYCVVRSRRGCSGWPYFLKWRFIMVTPRSVDRDPSPARRPILVWSGRCGPVLPRSSPTRRKSQLCSSGWLVKAFRRLPCRGRLHLRIEQAAPSPADHGPTARARPAIQPPSPGALQPTLGTIRFLGDRDITRCRPTRASQGPGAYPSRSRTSSTNSPCARTS